MMTAKRKRSIEGVLFDWDGTLINSYRADASAYLAMFKELEISWGIEELEKNYSPNWYEVYRAAGLPRRRWADADRAWRAHYAKHRPKLIAAARRRACDWRARPLPHGKASARGPSGVSDRLDRGIAGRSEEITPLMGRGS